MENKHGRVFWKSLFTHLAVVFVVALTLLPVSAQVSRILREQEVESRRTMLDNGLSTLTSQLKSLENSLTTSTGESFARASLINGAPAPSDVVSINKVREQVASIAGSNNLVADIGVFFYRNRMVITSRQSFYDTESFLDAYQFYGMEEETLLRYYENAGHGLTMRFYPCEGISSGSMARQETAFCYAIPLDAVSETAPRGVAFVFLRREPVLESMLTASLRESGSLSIADGKGDGPLMAYEAPNAEGTYRDDVVLTLVNAPGTLSVTARLPQSYFSQATGPVRQKLLLSLCLAALAGLLAALYASYRQSRPMRKLMQELSDKGFVRKANRDEYMEIRSSIESLKLQRDDVSQKLGAYQETFRSNLIDRLFHNLYLSEEQEKRIREEFAPFPERFLVCYGRIIAAGNDGKESEVARLVTFDLLRARLPEDGVFHLIGERTFSLIYPCKGSRQEAEDQLAKLLSSFDTMLKASVRLAAGGVCDDMKQVSRAYEEAKLAYLRFPSEPERGVRPRAGESVVSFEPDAAADPGMRMRDLQELYRLLLNGEEERATELTEQFFLSDESLMLDAEQRYYSLRGALLLAWGELPNALEEEPLLPKYQFDGAPEEILGCLKAACGAVCALVIQERQQKKSSQGEEFLTYLREHSKDPELCAATMAKAFGFSEKYLFSLFREQTGFSPASFLQRIRLEQAAELLEKTSLTTQEISAKVGFLNFSTFHKAFKREYGVAPGQFRQNAGQ